MLDASTPLTVPGSEVLAWVDLDSADVVWALPARPRLALAPDGQPDVSLLLYRRGANSPPDGGQLTLTVDLALTDQERVAARTAGEAHRPPPADPREQPPSVQVRTPSWVDGLVHAELLPGLTAEGRPSLLGDNTCVLTLQLDAAQAKAVQEAWDEGFPDATIGLTGSVEGGSAASAAAASTTHSRSTQTSTPDSDATESYSSESYSYSTDSDSPASGSYSSESFTTRRGAGPDSPAQQHVGSDSSSTSTLAAAASSRAAVQVPLQLHGPLRLSASTRTTRRTDLTL